MTDVTSPRDLRLASSSALSVASTATGCLWPPSHGMVAPEKEILMIRSRLVAAASVTVAVLTAPVLALAQVAVDGIVVPKSFSSFEGAREVIEHKVIGDDNVERILALPGRRALFGVCVITPTRVATLDAELQTQSGGPVRFKIRVEDGREFTQCLYRSLKAEGKGSKRSLTYCLACEEVATP